MFISLVFKIPVGPDVIFCLYNSCFTAIADDMAANNQICAGRRHLRRAKKLSLPNIDDDDDKPQVQSSIKDGVAALDEAIDELVKQRNFFTIWRTSSTTSTITSFSTNRSVTVSASIMCTYAGLVFNLC